MGLDKKDKKLLYLLDENSREQESSLGKKLNISKQVVNYRLNKLKNLGLITEFQTVLNIRVFDKAIYAQIFGKIESSSKNKTSEILNYLKNHPRVAYLAIYGGRFDYSISLVGADLQEFNEQLKSILGEYPNELSQYIVAMRLETQKFPRAYLSEKSEVKKIKTTFGSKARNYHPDEIDIKILSLMTGNARKPILKISEELKMPFSTVRRRLKNLEKESVILGYSILPNISKIGMENYKLFIKTKNQSENTSKKIFEFALIHPNISWYQKTFGSHDYEFRIEVEDTRKYYEILNEIKEKLSEEILDIESLLIFEELKEDYGVLLKK